jgi:hypothetical protein
MFGDHEGFYFASESDWDRAEAFERSINNPDVPWILTDRDVWHLNSFYHGPEVPHPEVPHQSEEFTTMNENLDILF